MERHKVCAERPGGGLYPAQHHAGGCIRLSVCLFFSPSCVSLVPSDEKGRLNISVCARYSSVDITCQCLILLKGMNNKMGWLTEQLYSTTLFRFSKNCPITFMQANLLLHPIKISFNIDVIH